MILVDSRVGSSFTSSQGRPFDILTALQNRTNGQAESCKLDSGDFAFEGNGPKGKVYVGIERKAIRDMLGSIWTKRYSGDQAVRMSDTYDICYLLVEGVYRPSKEGLLEALYPKGWKPLTLAAKGPMAHKYFQYSEVDKFICSMEAQKNVAVVRSTSPQETVWQIVNRYQWWSKAWDAHRAADAIKVQSEVHFAKVTWARKFAEILPGLGRDKARALASKLGTIEEIASALTSELRAAGLSEGLAAKVYGVCRGEAD